MKFAIQNLLFLRLLGEDRFLLASDYRHVDASPGGVGTFTARIQSLPARAQQKILGQNAICLYGLEADANA